MKIGKDIEVEVGDIILAQLHMGDYLWGVWSLAGDEPIDSRPDIFRPLVLSKKLVRYSFVGDPEKQNYYLISNFGKEQYFLGIDPYSKKQGDVWKVYSKSGSTFLSRSVEEIKYFHQLQHLHLGLKIDITRMKRYLYGKTGRKYRFAVKEAEYVECS